MHPHALVRTCVGYFANVFEALVNLLHLHQTKESCVTCTMTYLNFSDVELAQFWTCYVISVVGDELSRVTRLDTKLWCVGGGRIIEEQQSLSIV